MGSIRVSLTSSGSPQRAAQVTVTRSKWQRLDASPGGLAPVGLLVLLAVLAVTLASGHLYSVRQSRNWIAHSYTVIEATQGLFSLVQDVETGERGFLATGDPAFLDNYDHSRVAIPAAEAR